MSDTKTLSLLDSHRPILSSGIYSLTLTQTISANGEEDEAHIQPFGFTVDGPKYRLLPEDIATTFPPPDSVGEYANVLPHVSLTRSTLPWERTADKEGTEDGPPWLAILLVYETEKVTPTVVKQSDLDKTSRGDQTVLVIDADESFLKAHLPLKDDLKLLCHVRRGTPDVAVVLCGRVPSATGVNTAYLVSVEGCYTGAEFSGTRLVMLKSWRFTLSKQSLEDKLSNLQAHALTSVEGSTATSPPGAALFYYRMRGGGTSAAFYRGPFAPGKVQPPVDTTLPELRSGDALIRYKKGVGVFDVTYAAAWELGRLLALASPTFSQTLIRWKHDAKASNLAAAAQAAVPHIDFGKSAASSAGTAPIPLEISTFLLKLKSLALVPVNYLLPDQDAAPAESIRFFQVDEYWMRCLLEGAISIGRNLASDAQHEVEIRSTIEGNPATSFSSIPQSGFLLRSEIVGAYPNLVVEATDSGGATVTPTITRVLAPGLKLFAFDSVVKSFTLHPNPVELHCMQGNLPLDKNTAGKIDFDKTKTTSAHLAEDLMAPVTGIEIIPNAPAT